jgi:hypothetical protein
VRRAQYPRPAFVPTDLADVGALARNLAAAGFDAARPALFTCEGIFCYLPLARPRARPPPAPARSPSCQARATCARSRSARPASDIRQVCKDAGLEQVVVKASEHCPAGSSHARTTPRAACLQAARARARLAQAPGLRVCRRRLTLPAAQAAVDSVVAQISGVAARGSRLCLDAVPLGLVEGRVKPRRGWINGRDVRGPTPPRAPRAQPSAHSISSLLGAAH